MTIVLMGLDQHRSQITAEWLDTDTGEISRRRIRPADRHGFCRFLRQLDGKQVEAALYHHGAPQRRALLSGDGREWLEGLDLPAAGALSGRHRVGDD